MLSPHLLIWGRRRDEGWRQAEGGKRAETTGGWILIISLLCYRLTLSMRFLLLPLLL